MSKRAKHKIFINIYKLALEFSRSNKQILNELSHYLVDNLISKICIFIAQENNLTYQTTTKKGRLKTYNFPRLYTEILKRVYPIVPDYDQEVRQLHELRNLFQHGTESTTLEIRSEVASEYVRLTETLLKEIGIIEKKEIIEPTNYLKDEYYKEKGKVEQVDFAEEITLNKLSDLEKEFDQKITSQGIKSDLNFKIIVYPLSAKGELFNISGISNLKYYLEQTAKYGPYFDEIPITLFDDLSPNREGLQYIAKNELIDSILIQREGLVFYDWRYSMRRDIESETIPVDLLACYCLGFLYFLSEFFKKVKYFDKIKIIFSVSNLPNWKYSPHPNFMFNRSKFNFQHSKFRPIEKITTIRELLTKEAKQKIVQEIFNEILLCYGYDYGFNFPKNLKTYLKEN